MSTRKLAAACIAVLFVYYEIYRWIPLGRWNAPYPWADGTRIADIVIGILLLWFAWSFVSAQRIGMWTTVTLLYALAALDLWGWWVRYAQSLPNQVHAYDWYAMRTQILPIIGYHFPPPAGQVILDLILFPTALIVMMAAVRYKRDDTGH